MQTEITPELNDKLIKDARQFLTFYNRSKTIEHSDAVAAESVKLANRFGADPVKAELAGFLHDISAVIPNQKRLGYALANQIEALPEERKAPMILHQKISSVICSGVFGINDEAILSAVGCHTTLKANAALLDKIVFLADKIAWDQSGTPPYLEALLTALDESLDAAILVYLNHLWAQREKLLVIHPWMVAAREELLNS